MEKYKIELPIEKVISVDIVEDPNRTHIIFKQDYFYLLLKMFQITCCDEYALTIVGMNDEKYTHLKVNNVTKHTVSVTKEIIHDVRDITYETYLINLSDIREIRFN